MITIGWWYLMLKIAEFADTVNHLFAFIFICYTYFCFRLVFCLVTENSILVQNLLKVSDNLYLYKFRF